MDEIIFASAKQIAQAVRNKDISAVEVVEAHLRRIDAVNPSLNAVVPRFALLIGVPDRALAEARDADAALARGESAGPLHGVPMTVKDSHDTEGIVSTGGTKGRASLVPNKDATAVARMRAAGAIVLGKTNTPEVTLSFETDNPDSSGPYQQPLRPVAHTRREQRRRGSHYRRLGLSVAPRRRRPTCSARAGAA